MFEANSYGFRPGRSCHDAIAQCFARLCGDYKTKTGKWVRKDKWVLDADIKGFFDNIEHKSIQNATREDSQVSEWLKAGFIEAHRGTEAQRTSTMDERFKPLSINPPCRSASARVEHKKGYTPTKRGTPQGGVISPLLANIGLHGLEEYITKCNPIA